MTESYSDHFVPLTNRLKLLQATIEKDTPIKKSENFPEKVTRWNLAAEKLISPRQFEFTTHPQV